MQQLRMIWAMVVFALALLVVTVGFALPWMPEDGSQLDTGIVLVGVVVVAVVAIGATQFLRNRDLPCASGAALAGAYRTRLFLGIGVGELPALLGFVAAFVVGEGWLYLVGLAIAGVALSRVAPTESDVERVDADLRAAGCQHSLRDALHIGVTPRR